ncbi:hypothetical protein Micbo1qcDRAFT_191479 [Microdochium bolleyi]|uniref:Protein transport protein SEC31 n=1 Tax=Microdochium bolleyi TaxID=196109 RepID=A0A136JI51_9PEZI|nr:hypothetical protein Micbo1qcDRAFT_191479 [Microdochium bolleyi]
MVRLREISRTAAFAWSPGSSKPFLVTGTRAGAVDADFSDETKLELWDLGLDDQQQPLELQQPLASIVTDSRFYDIAWGQPSDDHPKGIIAGALENGSLDLWDAEKLLDGDDDALISRTTKHTGAIKSLQFNPLRPQILATAGAKGELFIYDVSDPESAFRLGTAAARSDDLECVAWNIKVAHILATGGSGGFVTVWDLKTKKASLTLNNNRKAVSSIAWDPNNSTKLLTATPDDTAPVILLWDLRNSNAPERTLEGHEQGVLSVSWCLHDPELLISSGKDNRTLIWNPATGERFGEFPEVTNWTFLTRFNPHNPSISATASFDGKITVQTLQNTNPSASQNIVQNSLDGEDFFTQAQTQPQGAAFSLPKAPRWLERPIGASFGFGGKLIVFRQAATQPGQKRSSSVQIARFTVDSEIGTATEKFEESLNSGSVAAICEARKEEAKTDEEKADWAVMETLLAENPRKKIVECLGVSESAGSDPDDDDEEVDEEEEEAPAAPKATLDVKAHKRRISTFFSSDGAEIDGEDFLASLSATKGAKTDNPFSLFDDNDSASEKRITQALTLGNFAKAVDVCLKEKRMADAFMIANCGGKELVDKVQAAYLTQKTGMPSYLRLLSSVIVKNLWDVVYNADLSSWKHTMITLCTYADPTEFPDLCEALGDRILESGDRKDANFCFLVGSKLEKVVDIWIEDLEEAEASAIADGDDTIFSIHARTLQQFIEKVSIFRHVTKFQDKETGLGSDWKLSALYDKYVEYADIVAAHGQLEVAQKYLSLLPSQYPAAALARERVSSATKKPAATPAGRQPVAATRTSSRAQPSVGYQAPPPVPQPVNHVAPSPYAPPQPPAQAQYGIPTPVANNPYAPPNATPSFPQAAPNPYAPPGNNPYAPQSGYQTPQPAPQFSAPAQAYGPPPTAVGGPPRTGTPSSRAPPKLSEVGNWNDVPVVSRPPPRKNTPSMAPVTSPFGAQPGIMSPPPTGQFGQGATNTPPPPPKGSGPPRAGSPSTGPQFGGALPPPPRTGSSLANAYAPPPSAQQNPTPGSGLPPPPPMGGVVPRTASPYNPPPSAGPPSNRYAPAPSAQQPGQPQQQNFAPPPAQGFAAPPPSSTGPPPRATGASPAAPPPSAPPKAAAPPQKPRHPAGDRSHIPANATRLVDVLSQDMQRIAAKAPASFAPQVKDTQKRLGLLFDHLNNEELVKPDTIEQLTQLANALETKNYPEAQRLQVEIQRDKTEECGNWMVGVKRLVQMSKVTN